MGMVVSAAISAVPFMDELEQPYPQLSPPKTISPPTKQRPSAQRPTRATSKGPSEPLKPVKPVNTIGPMPGRQRSTSRKVVTLENSVRRPSASKSVPQETLIADEKSNSSMRNRSRKIRKDTGPPKPLVSNRAQTARKIRSNLSKARESSIIKE